MRYLTQSGIPIFSEKFSAIFLVCRIALDAHANSVAKMPRPARRTKSPGPGAKRSAEPMTVINPPTTPIKTRHNREP
jgi:hypothetical protein